MNYWINNPGKIPTARPGLKWILFLLTVLCSWTNFYSQEIVTLHVKSPHEIQLKDGRFWFYEATGQQETEVTDLESEKAVFQKLPKLYPNFGFVKHDVWFRFIVENPEKDTLKSLLRLSNPNLDLIDLYQENKAGSWDRIASVGDKRPLENKTFLNRNFIVPFAIEPRSRDTFLLRVNNGGEQFHFVPSLVKYEFFLQEDAQSQLYFGIYFGIISFIFLFNLFSYFSLKEKTALWYALYVFCLGMLQISLVGYGSQYIWGGEYFSNHANPFFASASILFLLYFCMDYLRTEKLMPKVHRMLRIFHWAIVCCLAFSVVPISMTYEISVVGINTITLFLNIAIIPLAVLAIRKNLQQAKLFLLAFSVLILSVFGFVLKNFGILPSNFLTDFGLQIGSSLESILLSIGIVLRFKSTRETALESLQALNVLTERANTELERKVIARTEQVEKQKTLLEVKNKEIISSIAYAKRIQDVILPSQQAIRSLLPHVAIWYAPKDIVAGDFYWMNQAKFGEKSWIFFAVADCTGHGVPGAMMSVMCVNALDSSLKELISPDPGTLLEKVADYLSANLSSDNLQLADGMDISIACLDTSTNTLHWAGANNPLWVLRAGTVQQYTPTKRPVGKSDLTTPFETNIVLLQPKDRLYLFSDGYVDQFGGPKNKKLKRGTFIQVIEEHADIPLMEQMNAIKSTFFDWKGQEEQVDDVCIMGVEIHEPVDHTYIPHRVNLEL
jgi:serine phosphatase RsbU (regulator of sigma subunit)